MRLAMDGVYIGGIWHYPQECKSAYPLNDQLSSLVSVLHKYWL